MDAVLIAILLFGVLPNIMFRSSIRRSRGSSIIWGGIRDRRRARFPPRPDIRLAGARHRLRDRLELVLIVGINIVLGLDLWLDLQEVDDGVDHGFVLLGAFVPVVTLS